MRIQPLISFDRRSDAFFPVTSELLSETYLVPKPVEWDSAAFVDASDHPWADSFQVDPEGVVRAVDKALRELIHALPHSGPDSVDFSCLPDGRARRHLSALLSVWQQRGTVPEELHPLRHILKAKSSDAVVPLQLLPVQPDPFATATETAVEALLLAHHGPAPEAAFSAWQERQSKGAPNGALGAIQRDLLGGVSASGPDARLRFHVLRDSLHEARFAAALSRRLLESGQADRQSDIAVLAVDDATSRYHLAEAFSAQGLRLTGFEGPARRDLAAETARLALEVLRAPAPVMALASLATLPLMPWATANGAAMARDLMLGRHARKVGERLEGPAAEVWENLTTGARTGAQLVFKLTHLAERLQPILGNEAALTEARAALLQIAAAAQGASAPDWTTLARMTGAQGRIASDGFRHLDGISLFTEAEMPWRGCRHLIVTGFAGGHYPQRAATSPFFVDSERAELHRTLGLFLRGAREALARGIAMFQRQLSAASESITFLSPRFDGHGKRLAAPLTQSLIARHLGVATEDLATDPADLEGDAATVSMTIVPTIERAVPSLPVEGIIDLHRDLLALRKADDGRPLPQSPSRLETLLISPLSWLLAELDAEDLPWKSESLDVLLKGTLAHHVLEQVFPAKSPLPEPNKLPSLVITHFDEGVRKNAPFLLAPEWQMEHDGLLRDCLRAAEIWRSIIEEEGAEIIANEVTLSGEAHGIVIRGRADTVLRLPDDQIIIIDHKKSSSWARRERMQAGWDLQVALYRDMLLRPTADASPEVEGVGGKEVAVAYHTLNDGTVLRSGARARNGGSPRVEDLAGAISDRSIALLQERLAQVGAGRLHLNGSEDENFLKKEAKITPYGFGNSPLIRALLVEGRTIGSGVDEAEDEE
jgi:hypothetical protein